MTLYEKIVLKAAKEGIKQDKEQGIELGKEQGDIQSQHKKLLKS